MNSLLLFIGKSNINYFKKSMEKIKEREQDKKIQQLLEKKEIEIQALRKILEAFDNKKGRPSGKPTKSQDD